MTRNRIVSFVRRFGRKEDGTIAIEAMIILPMMFTAFLTVFSIFSAYRAYSLNQKAAFTIGDAISRETAPIDPEYLQGALSMFEYLAQSEGQARLRVTSLVYDADEDRFFADWSQTQGAIFELTSDDVRDWTDRLPVMPDNERVMLVETWSTYDPPFKTGLEQQEIKNFVFTRPRFAPRVCWLQCD